MIRNMFFNVSKISFLIWATTLLTCLASSLNAADDYMVKERAGWRHVGNYLTPHIVWQPELNVPNARMVIPHPEADAVAAAVGDGIYLTNDVGDSWHRAPGISNELAEDLTWFTFQDNNSSIFIFGTGNKGIWVSRDGGKTCQKLAGKAQGLASDHIKCVYYQKTDMSFNTLLAGHGGSAAGISRSIDGGRTWEVLYPRFHCFRLYQGKIGSRSMYMLGSHTDEPDVTDIYTITSLGKYWRKACRDVLLNDAITSPGGHDLYLATVDAGLIRIENYGQSVIKLGHDDVEWYSIGRSWYNTADTTQWFLYEPEDMGYVQSLNSLKTVTSLGRGPYQGRVVKEGARIRASAGGAVLYAVVNGALYIGKNNNKHRVDKVQVIPATVNISQSVLSGEKWSTFDQDLEDFVNSRHAVKSVSKLVKQLKMFSSAIGTPSITVKSRIVSAPGIDTVTVDLSRLGGKPKTQMYDDGKHDDDKAGDGIYAAEFPLHHTMLYQHRDDWRPKWPGSMGLTVTAQAKDGELAGGVGTLGIFIKPETFYFWKSGRFYAKASEGANAEITYVQERGKPRVWNFDFQTSAGPWTLSMGRKNFNISGYYALGFEIMPKQTTSEEINVQLRDEPTFTAPVTTPPIPIMAGKHIHGGPLQKDKWSKVSIPLSKMLKEADEFVPELSYMMLFSGNDKSSRSYQLREIRFFRTKQDLDKWLQGGGE